MENSGNFSEVLLQSLDTKAQWYDSEELPKLLENYRLLYTCVKNLFEFLIKKALITPDPYKLDKKISDIKAPDGSQFVETEKSVIMGQRFSDYESTLDFLCNYYKFSVNHLTLGNIKKLVDLNNAFMWSSFTQNCAKANTRVLATLISAGRHSSDTLTSSMISDSLTKASNAMNEINSILRDFTEFQKENYKGQVRRNIIASSSFDKEKAYSSPAEEMNQIKKNFASGMAKQPFYNELIAEIVQEDQGEDKEKKQQEVLAKLNVTKKSEKSDEKKIDTKEILMETVRLLGGIPLHIEQITNKIRDNHDILESEHNSIKDKFVKALRRAFGLPDKTSVYQVVITDQRTGAQRTEKIDYNAFMTDLSVKQRRYGACSNKKTQGYAKLNSLPEDKILSFLSAQITECQRAIVHLNALNDYFKNTATPLNKSRIKGFKIDVDALKNTIVKINQMRAEYVSYMEEEEQMRKLGIK